MLFSSRHRAKCKSESDDETSKRKMKSGYKEIKLSLHLKQMKIKEVLYFHYSGKNGLDLFLASGG